MARKYSIDHECFSKIRSEKQAYWLGFLIADGNVSKGSLRVELHRRDISHLHSLRAFMGSNSPIKLTRKNCCRVSFNSVILIKSLKRHHIVPNKTLITRTPRVKASLLRHFYRGVFDGDGWVTSKAIKRNGITYDRRSWELGFSSGSEVFIKEIQDWTCKQMERSCGYHIHRKRGVQQVHQLIFGGNKIFSEVANILYSNAATYLPRKYKTIRGVLDWLANTPRKKRVNRAA